ncbi:Myb-like_DNA-binding domain-containing protein [Hexamita inflata]|uniref:Myb-like DNA-binding domain-containing protein n=1 Tax=Hexamita inflata TaxID=28002 RepID=A0AA86UFN6_9EUKA|nr:Myb-like DNA-binding domain-containing protein [Hexamita inflata]
MQKDYKNWTETEKSQLVAVVEQSKRKCGQVDWDEVAKQMPSRSRQQCKSYFMNILKKSYDISMVRYHTWTEKEVKLLLWCTETENKNWDIIQQNYFPSLTKHKLQAKYSYLLSQQIKAKVQVVDTLENKSQVVIPQINGDNYHQLMVINEFMIKDRFDDQILISQLRDILNGVANK